MGFTRKMKTIGKVEIPEGANKEAELIYLHSITSIVEGHNISLSLIMNLDQTPLKYVPVSHRTMAKRGAKSVSLARSSDKRCEHWNICDHHGGWFSSSATDLWRKNQAEFT